MRNNGLYEKWSSCPDNEKVGFAERNLDFSARKRLLYKFIGQAFRLASTENMCLSKYSDNITYENVGQAGRDIYDIVQKRRGGEDVFSYFALVAYIGGRHIAMMETSDATVWYDFPLTPQRSALLKEQIAWCEEELFGHKNDDIIE